MNLCHDVLSTILTFLPFSDYYAFSEVSKDFRDAYRSNLMFKNKYKSKLCTPSIHEQVHDVMYLKWAFSHPGFTYAEHHAIEAAKQGLLPVLKYLMHRCDITDLVLAAAVRNKHRHIIKYLLREEIEISPLVEVAAARTGCMDIVEMLLTQTCESVIGDAAFESGNVKLAKMVVHLGGSYIFSPHSITSAVASGNLGMVKFCVDWVTHDLSVVHGLDWTATAKAASLGYLEILQYLREVGCPWNGSVFLYALLSNQPHCFRWAFHNGCPVKPEWIQAYEKKYGSLA